MNGCIYSTVLTDLRGPYVDEIWIPHGAIVGPRAWVWGAGHAGVRFVLRVEEGLCRFSSGIWPHKKAEREREREREKESRC